MPDPINLRQARKAKARTIKEQKAAQNRVSFGRSKVQTNIANVLNTRAAQTLDGAKLLKVSYDEPD